ncbi:MAG: N-6 DNA methylase [Verrucomicrobia bacterium]|nr:N-6 DNA methylase [Verrucomicrobiota bacterium]
MVAGTKVWRRPQKRADYLLRYRPGVMLAVIEAKASYKSPGDGLQQAKDYAETLDLKFAYSSNGQQIIGRGTRVRADYGKLWFSILDYTGSATRLFADPDFDGDPIEAPTETKLDEPIPEPLSEPITYPHPSDQPEVMKEPAEPALRKCYVDGGSVEIAAHVVYELDASGKKLRVVKFIVTVVNPRLGETILDPACGTGGFLAEAFEHLKKQCKTAEDHRRLQRETLFGIEAKPLPYLLCQMNLLLHGVETPNIDPLNALRFPLREIGDKDRVDVIMTNPPFGGEEERGILTNFPEDKQTAETALLFLQLIMRKLRRPPKPGRAAVVVPNGTLFGDGVCARIKEELLKDFNLHTIVRLPNGVFSPYTPIPTNVLFFDRSGPTRDVWYYEHPLPEGRKNYTKTQPLQFEEFKPLIEWWKHREENERAWKVPASELLANNCNLDRKNPRAKEDITHLPPEQLVASILEKEQRIAEIMGNIRKLLGNER